MGTHLRNLRFNLPSKKTGALRMTKETLSSSAHPGTDMRPNLVLMRIRAFEKIYKVKVSNNFNSKRSLRQMIIDRTAVFRAHL